MVPRLLLATIVFACFLAAAGAQTAKTVYNSRSVSQGKNLFRDGRYIESERLLAGALAAIDAGKLSQRETNRCLGPLTEIYFRWERHEDALRTGLRHGKSLRAAAQKNPGLLDHEVQDNAFLVGQMYMALGRYDEAEKSFRDAQRVRGGNRRGDPSWVLRVEAKLADVAELRGDKKEATARRQRLVELSGGLVQKIERGQLPARLDADCVAVLYNCLVLTGREAEAVDVLRALLDRQIKRGQQTSADVARVQLAELHAQRKEYDQAEAFLNQVLGNHRQRGAGPYTEASLLNQLADVQKAAGAHDRAGQSWLEAATLDKQLLTRSQQSGGVTPENALEALLRLRVAYRETRQLTAAIAAARRIVAYESSRHGNEHRRTRHAKSELGALYGAVGFFEQALPLLKDSLQHWRGVRPADPQRLANALNNLAAVQRATGNFDSAQALFEEALDLRKQHASDDDPRLAEAYNNLASVYNARGQYATALSLYRQALTICRAAGPRAEGLLSLLLHNIAMVYRSQGQLAKAADFSQQALDIGRRALDANPNSISAGHLAARYLAQASLDLAGDDPAAARKACGEALRLCQQHRVADKALAATAHRRLGTVHYRAGNPDMAESEWKAALAVQQRHGLRSEAARTLLHLADLAVERRNFDRAEVLYRETLAQQEDFRVLPIVHYNALVNLAQLLYYTAGEEEEAVALIARAVKLLEIPRAQTEGGGEGQRAEFFSRHAAAFDLLVDWNLRSGRIKDAILYAERGRNRTFLDQLRLAGVDLRDTLTDDQSGRRLRLREQQLSTRVSSLRALAVAAGRGQLEGQSLTELAEKLRQAQSEYAVVMAEIRDHSPFYRELLAERADIGSLSMIRRHVLTAGNMLLVYYLGERNSFLIAVDGRANSGGTVQLRSFPLAIPPRLAAALEVKEGPLTRAVATKLVGSFLATIRDREGARGLAGIVRSPRGMMDADQGTALAEVLLPRDVRALVADRGPEHLVVVPDGALHQMPLEALLVDNRPSRYVLDIFPPITYAPSATILAGLAARPKSISRGDEHLLTVGDPVYPTPSKEELATLTATGRSTFLDLGGVLSPLPGTAKECQRIYGAFGKMRATRLLSQDATEGNVRASLTRRRYLHVAAHGLVDERNDNLFGAIALTPPPDGAALADDDGFLRLHEIHGLRLAGCELAALSACQTNVGPRRPLEAGSTLARAFLAAGARRVVSSHWNVDDEASSELISLFFENLASRIDGGAPVDYARLMHEARRAIRDQEKWNAPYYWAPFVLVGPAQ